MLGSFGEIIFQVSGNEGGKIETFDDFVRTSAERWANHDLIGLKPKSEFLGPGLDKITFSMQFDVSFGMNPRIEMEKLVVMSRSGQVETLIVGGKPLGVNKWKIINLTQSWKTVDNRGNVVSGGLDITLEEYV
jgi:phage protein U